MSPTSWSRCSDPEGVHRGCWPRPRLRRIEAEGPVRSCSVVVLHELGEHGIQVATGEDQEMIQGFPADLASVRRMPAPISDRNVVFSDLFDATPVSQHGSFRELHRAASGFGLEGGLCS
jgi:hypothetical protein